MCRKYASKVSIQVSVSLRYDVHRAVSSSSSSSSPPLCPCAFQSSISSTLSLSSILVPIVGQPAQVTLNTLAAGPLPANAIHARIVGPTGKTQDAIVTPAPEGYNLRFNVPEPGVYKIEAEVCTLPLRPVQITAVEPIDPTKVRAYGPGLSQGTVNKPADFTVDTRGAGNGQLGVTVEGPSESKIDYEDNNDGSCRVTYHPTGSLSSRCIRHAISRRLVLK